MLQPCWFDLYKWKTKNVGSWCHRRHLCQPCLWSHTCRVPVAAPWFSGFQALSFNKLDRKAVKTSNKVVSVVLQNNGIHSLLTSTTSIPSDIHHIHSFWHPPHPFLSSLQNCVKNSPQQTIPQVISNSVLLLASPIYPPSLYSFCVCMCACVCVCVHAGVVCEEYNIMTI